MWAAVYYTIMFDILIRCPSVRIGREASNSKNAINSRNDRNSRDASKSRDDSNSKKSTTQENTYKSGEPSNS